MSADHAYFVYTLASRSRTLYTGVTNNLERRVLQHRQGEIPGFTAKYKTHRLVHFGIFADIRDAIRREKEIKGWRREKKAAVIEAKNPTWEDLFETLSFKKQVPHPQERVRDDSISINNKREWKAGASPKS